MTKGRARPFLFVLFALLFSAVPALATSTEELEKEVKALIQQNKALVKRLQEVEKELARLKAERDEEAGKPRQAVQGMEPAHQWIEKVHIGGILEFGAAYQNVDTDEGNEDESDLAMTTLELDVDISVAPWLKAQGVLLYEDPTFEDSESSLDVDMATITLGNNGEMPWGLTLGKMYLPFGSLNTHFPDDPFIDVPLSLIMGEINEKAVLVSYDRDGLSLSAYVFNGDVDERGDNNHISDYGFDFHFERGLDFANMRFYKRGSKYEHEHDPKTCVNFLVGSSFISDLADSDGLSDAVGGEIEDEIPGWDIYGHIHYRSLFLSVEYMSALDSFSRYEIPDGDSGASPSVWNIEFGFNYEWWKPLEVAFKLAGSSEAAALGYPETRYGINFNQELYEGITLSLGYLYDDYEDDDIDGRNHRNLFFSQMALEF